MLFINGITLTQITKKHNNFLKNKPAGLFYIHLQQNKVIFMSIVDQFSNMFLMDEIILEQTKIQTHQLSCFLDKNHLSNVCKFMLGITNSFSNESQISLNVTPLQLTITFLDASFVTNVTKVNFKPSFNLENKTSVIELDTEELQAIKQVYKVLPEVSLTNDINGLFITKDGKILSTDTKTAIVFSTTKRFCSDFYLPNDILDIIYDNVKALVVFKTPQLVGVSINNATNYIINSNPDTNPITNNMTYPIAAFNNFIHLVEQKTNKPIAILEREIIYELVTLANIGNNISLKCEHNSETNNKHITLSATDVQTLNVTQKLTSASCKATFVLTKQASFNDFYTIIFSPQLIKVIEKMDKVITHDKIYLSILEEHQAVVLILENAMESIVIITKDILIRKE